MKLRLWIVAAVSFVALAALAGDTRAIAPTYVAVDLGNFGWPSVSPADVNDSGQVVGAVFTTSGPTSQHAFSWTQAGGFVDLGTLGGPISGAQRVTDAGQVVGVAYLDGTMFHVFSWVPGGRMVDLGTLRGVVGQSYPSSVNENGEVVGSSHWSGYPPIGHGFSWTGPAGMVDVGTLGGTAWNTTAVDVNEMGWIVGSSATPAGESHAYLRSPAGDMTDLGTLRGTSSWAAAVNGREQVVGTSATASGEQHAFSWTQAGGMVDLGTLGGTSSGAGAVNDLGQVVGTSTTASGATHVFSWTQAGGMVDIGTLGGASTHLGFTSVKALNDAGQVVGESDTADGGSHAFVWSSSGGMVDLGTLGGTYSHAAAISANGTITGGSQTASGESHAVLWKPLVLPIAQAVDYRDARVSPAAAVDSVGATQPTDAARTWSAYMWNSGSTVVPAPTISVDTSSQTFAPPVTFPLSATGSDLQQWGSFTLHDIDGTPGHSHAVVGGFTTGFDVSRTMSPATIPAGGGTQTVTVSATLRDPATASDALGIQVIPGDLVSGAVVDPQSVVAPVADAAADAYLYVDPGYGVYWRASHPALDTTYTLTVRITVPNSGATGLRYKPTVMSFLAEPQSYLPETTGPSTTIPDPELGGTFTFSAGSDIAWSRSIVYSVVDVDLAPLAAPGDTTPPVLSIPGATVVDATSPMGAAVSYAVSAKDDVDPSPTVLCAPPSGAVFAIGTTTVSCTAADASGNAATASFTVHVKGAGEQLADLAAAVKGVGPGRSLADTVAVAQWFLGHGQPKLASLTLTAFQAEVRAQSGKKIPAAQAAALIADAKRIEKVIG